MNLLEFVLPTVLNYNLKSKSKVFDADEAFGGRAELPHYGKASRKSFPLLTFLSLKIYSAHIFVLLVISHQVIIIYHLIPIFNLQDLYRPRTEKTQLFHPRCRIRCIQSLARCSKLRKQMEYSASRYLQPLWFYHVEAQSFVIKSELQPSISTRPTHRRQGRQHITSTAVIKIMMLFIVRISIKWTAGRVRMRTSLLCQPSSSSIDSFKHLARH